MMGTIRVLFLGDVVGKPGCAFFQKHIGRLRKEHKIDAVLVNGENSASNGRGITSKLVDFFKHNSVDVITSGNHIWDHREIYPYLAENTDLLRPANFPSACPGVGVTTFECNGVTVGVVNLQGRVFMRQSIDCPFKKAESILSYLQDKTKIIIVDFHAETGSEKNGMGYFLDGKVSAVVGTHTHVQTADERILPGGTAYITDLGMGGALNSMIGMKKDPIIQHFLTQMPIRFVVEEEGEMILCGVVIEVDTTTGKALSIKRIRVIE